MTMRMMIAKKKKRLQLQLNRLLKNRKKAIQIGRITKSKKKKANKSNPQKKTSA